MLKKIFNHQTKSIAFSSAILAVFALLNGVLALFRDRFLANRFGAGRSLDIYFAAFRIPDFIYSILIAGGIISVFLPIFSGIFNQNKEDGWHFANSVLNYLLVLLIIFCSVLAIFTPFVIRFFTPGFAEEGREMAVLLTRIMLLSPVLFVISSLFSGILHYFNRFLVYSFAPILYNLGIIFGVLFLVPVFGLLGLAFGVVLGALLHLTIQIPSAVLAGFRYRPIFNFKSAPLKNLFKLMIPRTIGAAASQINLIVITAIGSLLVSGSIAIFNFSNNLQKFPAELIGLSFGVAAFPILAKNWAAGQKREFLEKFFSVFRQTLFLITPLSGLLFILRAQIVRLILGTGQFGWLETRLTAASLGIFSFGLFAFCLIPLLTRAFFSLQDTKTPVTIGIFSIIVNIFLCFIFISFLNPDSQNIFQKYFSIFLKLQGIKNIQVVGLSLAVTLSGILNFFLLLFFFFRKIKKTGEEISQFLGKKLKETNYSLIKILIAGYLTSFFVYIVLRIIVYFVDMQSFLGVFLQTLISGIFGFFIYFLIMHWFKSAELKRIKSLFLSLGAWRDL